MDDITDKLNMTAEMKEALASDEAAKTAADSADKVKESMRQKILKRDAFAKNNAQYMDNWKTQPRGMNDIQSIPDMKAGTYDLAKMTKAAGRKTALKNMAKGIGRGVAKGAGIAGAFMHEGLNDNPEGSPSAIIEDPKSTKEQVMAAMEELKTPSQDEDSYFAELRRKKVERMQEAQASQEEPEIPDYPEYVDDIPMPEETEEKKAFDKKAARMTAIRQKIKDGTY